MLCVLPHRTLLHVACVIFGGCLRAQQTQTVRDRMETLGFTLQDNLFYYLDHGGQHSESYWGEAARRGAACVQGRLTCPCAGARFHVPMTSLYPPAAVPPAL